MERTKKIAAVINKQEGVYLALNELIESKQTTYNSRSSKWQDSEAGEQAMQDITDLEEVRDSAEELYNKLNDDVFPEEE